MLDAPDALENKGPPVSEKGTKGEPEKPSFKLEAPISFSNLYTEVSVSQIKIVKNSLMARVANMWKFC